MSAWANAYVGIPYVDLGRDHAGCDCWGLVRLVYATELGIDLPSGIGAYVSAEEREEVAALLSEGAATGHPWLPVSPAAPFDLLTFRRGRRPAHVGIALGRGRFLHVDRGEQARIARLDEPRHAARLAGIYRHVKRGVE